MSTSFWLPLLRSGRDNAEHTELQPIHQFLSNPSELKLSVLVHVAKQICHLQSVSSRVQCSMSGKGKMKSIVKNFAEMNNEEVLHSSVFLPTKKIGKYF